MKLFDLHADIGYDLLNQSLKGDHDRFSQHHLPKLEQGEVYGVGMVSFFEGHEDLARAQAMVSLLHDQIHAHSDCVHPYLGGEFHPTKINALMTLESMCYIQDNPEEVLSWMYEKGVRVGSLTWNEENALATGAKSNPSRGLTPLGRRAIQHMNHLGMIVDVSHTNEKSFWDILECSSVPVIASHSNSRLYANVHRNLSDQQALALMNKGGLIGLVAARYFVHDDEALQDAYHLALHAKHWASLKSVDHIAIGFDYMDFLEGDYGRKAMAHDLQDATQSQNLVKALRDVGFSEEDIEKIAWKNVQRFFLNHLK